MTSTDVIQRSEQRRQTAEAIVHDLDLMNRWRRFGRPVLVGALAIDVAVAPDIDMEIYCPELKIEHGFQVISECALNPRVTSAQFVNGLNTPDKAFYWQLHYRTDDGVDWKIDMWSAPEDYPLPRGEHFVQPMKNALTPETRVAILTLKEARAAGELPMFLSIDLYRAVIEGCVRTPDQWRAWLQTHETGVLSDWRPAMLSCTMHDININFDSVAEFYDAYVNCDFDLDFWRGVARASPGPRLELMCGTGRITLAILRDGVAIEGLDYSQKLLDVFRNKLASADFTADLHFADARCFDLGRQYGLIFLGFHSIAEVISDDDKRDVFRNVRRHLADNGEFWISIHNPPQRRASLDGMNRLIGTYRLATGEILQVSGEYCLDNSTDIATGRQVYRCSVGDRPTRSMELPMQFHLISPERLDCLLADAGLVVVRRLGDYVGGAFDFTRSAVYIAQCRIGD